METARRAVRVLRERELVVTLPAKGTYVVEPGRPSANGNESRSGRDGAPTCGWPWPSRPATWSRVGVRRASRTWTRWRRRTRRSLWGRRPAIQDRWTPRSPRPRGRVRPRRAGAPGAPDR
nr:hypothetical protein [Actinomadura sp. KC216]